MWRILGEPSLHRWGKVKYCKLLRSPQLLRSSPNSQLFWDKVELYKAFRCMKNSQLHSQLVCDKENCCESKFAIQLLYKCKLGFLWGQTLGLPQDLERDSETLRSAQFFRVTLHLRIAGGLLLTWKSGQKCELKQNVNCVHIMTYLSIEEEKISTNICQRTL